jgi:hypothetical protein
MDNNIPCGKNTSACDLKEMLRVFITVLKALSTVLPAYRLNGIGGYIFYEIEESDKSGL